MLTAILIGSGRLAVGAGTAAIAATAISAARGLLLLPITTKALAISDYGLWAQLNVAATLLTYLSLAGLDVAVITYLSGERDRKKDSRFTTALLVCNGVGGALALGCIAVSLVFAPDHAARLAVGGVGLLVVAQTTERYALIQFRRIFRFWSHTGALAVLTAMDVIGIWIPLTFGLGIGGAVWAWATLKLITSVGLLIYSAKRFDAIGSPHWTGFAALAAFGAPLLAVAVLGWVLNLSDRFLIGWLLDVEQVAFYSVSYSIGSLVALAFGPILLVVQPRTFGLWHDGNSAEAYRMLWGGLDWCVWLGAPFVGVLAIWAPEILARLTRPEYSAASGAALIVAIAVFVRQISSFAETDIMLTQHSRALLPLNAIAAVTNVAANLALLPVMGYMGAALAALLTASVHLAVGIGLASRRSGLHFRPWRVLAATASASAAVVMVMWIRAAAPEFTPAAIAVAVVGYTSLGIRSMRAEIRSFVVMWPSTTRRTPG